ncbi:MAG TPA: adenylate/guanylate cyclase domain-containing protein [Verrucomicrobiae bacterium]|nr:adenylate/guanylate cyclase domain-containing protein [Verrucomicrobiae bacterium]
MTILFADLAGFTKLTTELGAEKTHALLNRQLALLDDLVTNYGGGSEYIGDAIMAVFGAPIAHSDDPIRAARAAGDMHGAIAKLGDEIGRPLKLHIGIASGQVVAGGLGSDSRTKYTVIGDSVNLASRLSSLAEPGETLVSDTVSSAIGRQIRCEAAGTAMVKGIDQPIHLWRITGDGETAGPQFDTPFVGRQGELRQLAGLIDACRDSNEGHVVLLRGEAGIGKTRTAAELLRMTAERGFSCHRSLVLDFGAGKGQDAVGSLARSLLGIAPGTSKSGRATQIAAAIGSGLVDKADLVFLNDLVDVAQPLELRAISDAMSATTRQQGRESVLQTLLRRLAAQKPVMILIEDVHWADPPVLSVLAALARVADDAPAILAMTTRIEGDPIDAAWRGQAGGGALAIVDLGPLRRTEARALAVGLAITDDGVIAGCIERAEGNPLFLEQLLRNAGESNSQSMPASIQSLVLARADRLPPLDKRALQAAAVVGQRFTLEAMRAMTGVADYMPQELLRHRLIRADAGAFLFAHALIRDGIYDSLLTQPRQDLHRAAAQWFDKRDPVLKALHLDLAGDAAAALAYDAAARSVAAQYRNDQALTLAEMGLALATDDRQRVSLEMLHGQLLQDAGQAASSIEAYERALKLASDDRMRVSAWYGLAAGHRILDRYAEAERYLAQAQELAERHNFKEELTLIHHLHGNLHFPQGRIEECVAEHQRALELAQEIGSPEAEARALGGLADAEYARGRMLSSHARFKACVELAREHGLGRIEVANMNMMAFTHLFSGDVRVSLKLANAAVAAAMKVGHQRAEVIAREAAFECNLNLCNSAEAREQITKSLALSRRLGTKRFESEDLVMLAAMDFHDGRVAIAEAMETAEAALALGRETGMKYIGPSILGILARITPDAKRRSEALAEAEEILSKGALKHNHLWFYREAIEVSLESGEWSEARRYAEAMEACFLDEPTPWSSFFASRGRALAAWGEDACDAANLVELKRLRGEGDRMGYLAALPLIERALASQPKS